VTRRRNYDLNVDDATSSDVSQAELPLFAPPPTEPISPGVVPTFSVVIAAYNAETTILEAVGSALEQTLPAIEVIVVDDGSTDGTASLLQPLRERITLIRTENHGPSAARNEGARHATGDFIAVLDADDIFLPTRLEALAALAVARPDLDLLNTNVVYEHPGREPMVFYSAKRPFPVGDQRAAILASSFPQHPAIRRTAFERAGGYDDGIHVVEDWDLWLRLILSGSRAGLVDVPLLRYRQLPSGLTADVDRLTSAGIELHRRSLLRDDLTPQERAVTQAGLEERERLLELYRTRAALRTSQPGWRHRAWQIARTRGYSLRARLGAGLAAILPGFAVRASTRAAGVPMHTPSRSASRR
jgi:glycosyl transferase family 2